MSRRGVSSPLSRVERLLGRFDVDPARRQKLELGRGWECYSIQRADGADPPVQVILVAAGPKNVTELKKEMRIADEYVMLSSPQEALLVRVPGKSYAGVLDSDAEYRRVEGILESIGLSMGTSTSCSVGLSRAIDALHIASEHFDNRGVFSNQYLRARLWDDIPDDINQEAESVCAALPNTRQTLKALGWDLERATSVGKTYRFEGASVIVAPSDGLSVRTTDDVAPSYTAVAELKHSAWVILTNGRHWRLYTSRVSASTTNYLEIDAGRAEPDRCRYLAALFSARTYDGAPPQIDKMFERSHLYTKRLEEDLSSKILAADGLFLDLVKGILDHDKKTKFGMEDLAKAKKTGLAVLYRIWFILYAESRSLLPVQDPGYGKISLRSIHDRLDGYSDASDDCWQALSALFDGIRDGSPEHNLPQYDGDLFRQPLGIDCMQNKFLVKALRSLLETDGRRIDYGELGVRHLGNIYEKLLEFDVRQADRDIMLLEDKGGAREVSSKEESTYSYKKNDLYLASGGGIVSRKSSASFYTPDGIVSFLVRRGLEPLLAERRDLVERDVKKYEKDPSEENRTACIDRLLDLQVLDPAMGSGHFLAEALNQITRWATEILNSHPSHPLVAEIEHDRQAVLQDNKDKGITIDKRLLTADVLLKRRVMKRCIFGVDLNPLAVELARLSLWLDSFAIGVPLTYLNHHVKHGDSTIGEWLGNLRDPKARSLDEWLPDPAEHGGTLARVSYSPDITMEQVRSSRKRYAEYENQTRRHSEVLDALAAFRIDPSIVPKAKREMEFLARLARPSDGDKIVDKAKARVAELAERYGFFHWELEMMDAFTDSRRGFDLVVGNPPWETSKPSKNEFFTPYDSGFRNLKPDTRKTQKAKDLLKDPEIRQLHGVYKQSFRDKAAFYKQYKMQGSGDKDLWQLVMERVMGLVAEGGVVSMLIPSQLLGNAGATAMRGHLLDLDITQMYVFENRKKIFDIDSRYRFVLLTARNQPGPDKFPTAFYLHDLASLQDQSVEKHKFTTCSKRTIKTISPSDLVVPEVPVKAYALLEKLSTCPTMDDASMDGWQVTFARGFDTANDSDLFREDGKGWFALKGRSMHQFNHAFTNPDFTVDKLKGLRRLEKKKVYNNNCRDFHDSYMIVFRYISSATNMRTVIAAIVPPHTFHLDSLRSIILTRARRVVLDDTYHHKIAYLVGVLNSMTFDFIARAKAQMHVAPIIKHLFVPNPSKFDDEIAVAAARLSWGGGSEFSTFASSFGSSPTDLSPAHRIDTTARLDALVARAYGLTKDEYRTVLDSFKFDEDPSLLKADEADWSDNKVLRKFYGEVRKAAMPHFEKLEGTKD